MERGSYSLTLFLDVVPQDAVWAVQEEVAELALISEPPLLILAYRFGRAVPWGDVPYAWSLAEGPGPTPAPADDASSLFWVSLVDARDGQIRAQRGLPMDAAFARALGAAVREQANQRFDGYACLRALGAQYLGHTDTRARLGHAIARMRSEG